jgi:DNA (cytosine-5)-methyltransferase 1
VPGVLSTKDNAFGCFLGALAGSGCALQPPGERWANAGYVRGPKRQVCWRVFDAQYFGVAQRRRRVFVVANAGDRISPAEVLFEQPCLRWNPPARTEAGQGFAADAAGGAGGGRRGGYDAMSLAGTLGRRGVRSHTELDGHGAYIPQTVGTLSDGAHNGGGLNGQDAYSGRIFAVRSQPADGADGQGDQHNLGRGADGDCVPGGGPPLNL